MSRLRVSTHGMVYLDVDIRTLVIQLLMRHPAQQIRYPLTIETTVCEGTPQNYTQMEYIEPEPEDGT